jgi:predicted metalloendopeptidase
MSDIIARIKNLMDLAGNNTSEEEAANAMTLARKLMLKHNLSENDLAESENRNFASFGELKSFDKDYIRILFKAVGEMTSTSFVMYNNDSYKIVGRPINQAVADELLAWLIVQVEKLYKIHLPKGMSKQERAKYRKDFKRLCSFRIFQRANELVSVSNSSDGTALIVLENQLVAEVKELFKEQGIGAKKSRIKLDRSSRGGREGYNAGAGAALHREVT